MPKAIETQTKTIKELFSNEQNSILGSNGIFAIPEYQRPYSWTASEQCDKLWQDLDAAVESSSSGTAYFLGSIIIDTSENDFQKSNKHYLIDGQQRVTTFFLLLKALLLRINAILEGMKNDEDFRTLKSKFEDYQKDIIRCLYIFENDDDVYSIIDNKKLINELNIKYCNESINEPIYESDPYSKDLENILLGTTVDEIKNKVIDIKFKKKDNRHTSFYKNFMFFVKKFDEKEIGYIKRFADVFLSHCQVITVISYQIGEAIDIFNSLNSTGTPLSDADVISANLYKGIPWSEREDFKIKWSTVVQDTNELQTKKVVDIDDIFNQYMYILRAEKGESSTTLPSVRKYFLNTNSNALKNPMKFINDIELLVKVWKPDDKPILSETINLQNVKQVLLKNNSNFKFFLATYLYFHQQDSETEKLLFSEELLKLFAILSIPNMTETYSSSNFKQFLINLNMEVGKGLTNTEIVEKIHKHILSTFKKDEIKQNLIDSPIGAGLVYLNEYLFAKENNYKLDLSFGNIEIEHIMPASGKNLISIRQDAGLNESDFESMVNLIGNKILLEQNINGSISNEWFKLKKQSSINDKCGYKDSRFSIAQSLISYPSDVWTKNDIKLATEKAATRIADFIFS